MAVVESEWQVRVPDFAALHRWSIAAPEAFWRSLWDFCGIVAETRGERVVAHLERMPGAAWFPEARLNFAENLLRRRDAAPALIFQGEERGERTSCPFAELHGTSLETAQFASSSWGVAPEIASPATCRTRAEAVVAMLACDEPGRDLVVVLTGFRRAVGCRPLRPDRTEVAVLGADGYFYNGKPTTAWASSRRSARSAARRSSGWWSSIRYTDVERGPAAATACRKRFAIDEALAASTTPGADRLRAAALRSPALHPLLFGHHRRRPKCIVHGSGWHAAPAPEGAPAARGI